jgi:hypothetical protein
MTTQTDKRAEALKAAVEEAKSRMQCNCDLDNWQPERSTGHSCVCRVHKAAMAAVSCSR